MFLVSGVLLISGSLFLGGCTPPEPTMFGIPQSQWNQLSPAEKREVIKGYNEQQKINAQNAPVESLISGAQSVIEQKQAEDAWRKSTKLPPLPAPPAMPAMPAPPAMPNMP